MNTTLLDLIVIISGVLGFFISISLLVSPFYKNHANRYLSISLFILTGITLLGWYNAESGIFELLQSIMWEFLIAVTLFTYFLIQIEHKYLISKWYKFLYFPFFSTLIIDVFLHFSPSYNDENTTVQVLYFLEDNLAIIYSAILIVFARILIKQNSTLSNEKRHWLLRVNLYIIIIIVVWILSDFEDAFLNSTFVTGILWSVLSFFSWWVLYYGVFKLQIVVQKDEIHQHVISQKTTHVPVRKKESTNPKIITQLYKLMDEDQLYKDPLLSRLDIAKKLDISESHLSKITNREINKSIIQLVNSYRIETAKQLLLNPIFNKYAIEAIGLESGFKSKSAFYNSFKSSTGMSPGAYKKLQKKS